MGVENKGQAWSISNGIIECDVCYTDGAVLWSCHSTRDWPGMRFGPSALPAVALDGESLRVVGGVEAELISDGNGIQTLIHFVCSFI